ncbi:hypothetical protein [Streptomyces rochei]|uniref:hypothetical protein n=1 Tax=Streptomyces rochei TaxID=1928 RepID=UPI0036646514
MVDEVWRKPFRQFLSHMEDSERLTRLTYKGIRGVVTLIEIGGILRDGAKVDSERHSTNEELQRLSNAEISSDFPLLHAHAIMGEWGALECLVEDLVEAWVKFKPETLELPVFARVKVPLADFLNMAEGDRTRFLVAEVQRDLKLDLKSGATKFEKLLDAIGLGGPVDSRVKDALYEAQNIRNVWAHRAGIADRRLVEACPNLNFTEGERVNVSSGGYARYRNAFFTYAVTVLNRCHRECGYKPLATELPEFEGALRFDAPEVPSGDIPQI